MAFFISRSVEENRAGESERAAYRVTVVGSSGGRGTGELQAEQRAGGLLGSAPVLCGVSVSKARVLDVRDIRGAHTTGRQWHAVGVNGVGLLGLGDGEEGSGHEGSGALEGRHLEEN